MSPAQLFRQSWNGNNLESWGTALGVAVVISLVLLLGRYLFITKWGAVAARTRSDLDDFAVDLIRRTRYFFILFLSLWAGAQFLDLEPSVERWFEKAAVLVFLLQAAIWGNGLVSFWVRSRLTRGSDSSGS
jgi:hypothetical protein